MRSLPLLVLLATGCAAPGFVGQVGRVTPVKDVRLGLGAGYQVNTSAAAVVLDGRDLARQLSGKSVACPDLAAQDCWTLADVRPVVRAGMRFALAAPLSANTSLSGRYGYADGLDVGLRFGPDNKGLDLGWQAFGPRDAAVEGWAGSLFAGWTKRDMGTLGAIIEDVLQGSASLDDYSLTFVAGRQFRQVAHVYLGGRYIYSRWKVQVLPDLPIVYDGAASQRALLGTDPSGSLHHVGAVLGAAVGWRSVFLGAELNLLQTFGRAEVLFEEVSLSGFGVMPAVYLYGQF
ncbi:MAG: hypothetical protein IPO09_13705 [Anaeromyxobacter sp.]|nr:hypothetical protein [Anaeromyxobacter sp.]MBL0275242.1 hypothetical protein [Anaeromyxobacter sp.]